MADTFAVITNFTTTVTDTTSFTEFDRSITTIPTKVTVANDVVVIVVLEVPLTCNNLRDYYRGRWSEHMKPHEIDIEGNKPHPDISGVGVREPTDVYHAHQMLI